jgi:hypothetical protein
MAARLELLKWVGLAAMLVDHVWRFFHVDIPGAEWIGRLAFPCFAVAVALQTPAPRRVAVAIRLVAVACVVVPLQSYVAGHLVGSVLFTLALGLLAADAIEGDGVHGVVPFVLFVAAGLLVEYSALGVLLVAGAALMAGRLVEFGVACVAVAAVGLQVRAGVLGAPIVGTALCLVAAYLATGGVPVGRVKGFFLRAYVAQWVLMGVGVALFSRRY